jgi:hypothetical protein
MHQAEDPPPRDYRGINFQFPLLGFLLCICVPDAPSDHYLPSLSIPFIGIFVMHLFLLYHTSEAA